MSAYVANAAILAMTTLQRSLVAAEFGTTIINSASAIDATQCRTGLVIPTRKLEFPTVTALVGDSSGHRFIDWRVSGTGRPVVWEDDPTAPIAKDLLDSGRMAADSMSDYESQRYINTLCVLTAPDWAYVTSANPRWRLTSVTVTVAVLSNVPTTRSVVPDNTTVFTDDQDLASELIVRAHRVPYAKIRTRQYSERSDAHPAPVSADFVSSKVDAGAVASKKGMTARPRGPMPQAGAGNMPITCGAYRSEGTPGGDLSAANRNTKCYPGMGKQPTAQAQSFQAMTQLGPESIGPAMYLAPRDALVISITASDRLLFDTNAVPLTASPNVVFPVRSYLCVAEMESEFGS